MLEDIIVQYVTLHHKCRVLYTMPQTHYSNNHSYIDLLNKIPGGENVYRRSSTGVFIYVKQFSFRKHTIISIIDSADTASPYPTNLHSYQISIIFISLDILRHIIGNWHPNCTCANGSMSCAIYFAFSCLSNCPYIYCSF